MVLFVLVIAGLLAAPNFIDWTKYKDQIVTQIEKETGFELEIGGQLDLALLPFPRLMIEDLSVAYPEKYKQPDTTGPFLSVKKILFQADLFPLMQGQVVIHNVVFEDPDVHVDIDENGKLVVATIALDLLKGNAEKTAADNSQNPMKNAVALNEIKVKNGIVHYNNAQKGQSIDVKDMNISLQAETLNGPFIVDGALNAKGQPLDLYIKTGRVDNLAESMALQIEAQFVDAGAKLEYSGVFAKDESFELQGETSVKLDNLRKAVLELTGKDNPYLFTSDFSSKGILKWDGKDISYQNLHVSAASGSASFTGTSSFKMGKKGTVPKVDIELQADSDVKLDGFIPQLRKTSDDAKGAKGFVPDEFIMPMDINLSAVLSLGNARYKDADLKDVSLSLSKSGKQISFKAEADADDIGSFSTDTKVDFAKASTVKDAASAVRYSSPIVKSITDVNLIKLAALKKLGAGDALQALPSTVFAEALKAQTDIEVTPSAVRVKAAAVNIFDSDLKFSGAYKKQEGKAADKLELFVSSSSLNLDDISAKMGLGDSKKADQKPLSEQVPESLQKLELPFDYDVTVSSKDTIYKLMTHDKLEFHVVRAGERLTLKAGNLINSAEGLKLTMTGSVGNLSELDDLKLNASFETSDWKKTWGKFGGEVDALPFDTDKAQFITEASGDFKELSFATNVKALSGSFDVSGKVKSVLEKQPEFSDLVFRLRHPNYERLIQAYTPSFYLKPGVKKMIDLYAKVESQGKSYSFSDVKAQIGSLKLDGKIDVSTEGKVPAVTSDLRFDVADIQQFVPGKDTSKKTRSSGNRTAGSQKDSTAKPAVRWSRNAINTSWMHKANVDLSLTGNRIDYGLWKFKKPDVHAKIKNGILMVDKFDAEVFGGKTTISAEVKSFPEPRQPISVSGHMNLTNVFLQDLTDAFSGASLVKAKGMVSLDTKLKSSGLSPAALIFDLEGDGKVFSDGVIIHGLDLQKLSDALSNPSSSLGENIDNLLGSATSKGTTEFDGFEAGYKVNEGIVTVAPFALNTPAATVTSGGTINLPLWTIDMKNTVKLTEPKDAPPIEVMFTGPLDKPLKSFGEDILERYIESLIKNKVEEVLFETMIKKGILSPTARPSEGKARDTETEQPQRRQEISPEEALFGILQNVLE